MQLVGAECAGCQARVVSVADAVQCPKCDHALHRACLRVEGTKTCCPSCSARIDDRPSHRIVARACLVCGRVNLERQERCTECKSALSWKDAAEHEAYQTTLRQSISPMTSRGVNLLGIGVLIVAWPIFDSIRDGAVGFGGWGLWIGIGTVLITAGTTLLLRAKHMRTRLGAPIDWWSGPRA